MEIIGRLITGASMMKIRRNAQLLNFTVTVYDYIQLDNSAESKQITTYIFCTYWKDTKITDLLKDGVQIKLTGRIGVRAYSVSGETRTRVVMQVSDIKVYSKDGGGSRAADNDNITPNITASDPI